MSDEGGLEWAAGRSDRIADALRLGRGLEHAIHFGARSVVVEDVPGLARRPHARRLAPGQQLEEVGGDPRLVPVDAVGLRVGDRGRHTATVPPVTGTIRRPVTMSCSTI